MSSLLIWLFLSTFQIKRLYLVCQAPAVSIQNTLRLLKSYPVKNKSFATNSFSYSWPPHIEHIYPFSKIVKLTKLSLN
jgi:hypothetical protein